MRVLAKPLPTATRRTSSVMLGEQLRAWRALTVGSGFPSISDEETQPGNAALGFPV